MRYHALACDYDGTLAHDGRLEASTVQALRRLRDSGRRLLMVTGRQYEDLQTVCDDLELFDAVVAENGALLVRPATRQSRVLAEAPPALFVETLRQRGVGPVAVGQVIVATWHPHEQAVLETIRKLGLELQMIFNKGAIMVLPTGVNKATGLLAALAELGLSPHNTVAVGDAENDHALLAACECGVAVANALPALKARADLVTRADHGAGVAELCERLMATDLAELAPALARHDLPLGQDLEDQTDVLLPAHGCVLLVAGTSGSGKSTAVSGVVEQMAQRRYQYAILDPEGDYASSEHAVVLGAAHHAPTAQEVMDVLAQADRNVVVNLVGLPLEQRAPFFEGLLLRFQEMRARFGRPHWVVVDEAHHLFPRLRQPASVVPAGELHGLVLVTVHPAHVAPPVAARADLALAIGQTPDETLAELAAASAAPPPEARFGPLPPGQGVAWWRRPPSTPRLIRTLAPRAERQRHVRKYADGELPPERSFYFRGPEGRLNLRAQNLNLFLQVAEGVDSATWLHHLRAGDYSRWARDAIKDEALAAALGAIERAPDDTADAATSRRAVRRAIQDRYTAPP